MKKETNDWHPDFAPQVYVGWARRANHQALKYPSKTVGRWLNAGTRDMFMSAARKAKQEGCHAIHA